MIPYKKLPLEARIFANHGVDFTDERGDELIGTCPFTDKPGKFYVNTKTWLWDSKTAGMSGNVTTFLTNIHEDYFDAIDDEQRIALARDRKLPRAAFEPWRIGWTGDTYVIPVRNYKGQVQDLRMYDLKDHVMKSTAGCKVGLLGAERLKARPTDPIYLCEGEWDAIAMTYLLKLNNAPGVALAVPGAGTFKQEWVNWFTGRTVHACYDHDTPGLKGEDTMIRRIGNVAKHLTFTHWPAELPDGFDLRDWVVYGLKKKTPDLCFDRLRFLFKKQPRAALHADQPKIKGKVIKLIIKPKGKRPGKAPTLDEVHATFNKWLHHANLDAVNLMLAVVLSQRMIEGHPIWLFLVGAPGGSKTVTMSAIADYEHVYSTSSLTAHSLISGMHHQGQVDPSLIPRLNDKILAIKDFTSILGLRDQDKEEIFSILRDAYDGKCGKVFGNGVERSYTSKFSIIAAVTPKIYELGDQHQALGERFLKFMMGDNMTHEGEEDIISRAIENVDADTQLREELGAVTAAFLAGSRENYETPRLDNTWQRRIVSLSQFGARLRGSVSRNAYNAEMMVGKPFAEVGSRLGIQLAKLARALALVHGKPEVTFDEYRVVKKVMLDTISQRNEDFVRLMHEHCTGDQTMTTQELSLASRYPQATVRRVMDDLVLLDVVTRSGGAWKPRYTLSPYIRGHIAAAGLYRTEPDLHRPIVLKRRRRPTD